MIKLYKRCNFGGFLRMNQKQDYKIGLISAVSCAVVWGLLPIYWNSLRPVSSGVIIFYRIVLMALVCYIVCAVRMGAKMCSVRCLQTGSRRRFTLRRVSSLLPTGAFTSGRSMRDRLFRPVWDIFWSRWLYVFSVF